VSLDDDARAELAALEAAHRLRVPRVVDGAQGPRVTLDGVEVVSFASNDYLGLAGDRRLADAAAAAAEICGVGAGASRLIVGNHRRHVAAERAVADWLRRRGVSLFGTGYAANVGVMTTVARRGDVVFSDELNHASIIDGCRLSRAEVVVFPHRDLSALEQGLRRSGGRKIVVSETVFSMDGDVADVRGLAELCRRHDAVLVLDEAHALGARGPEGRGVAAEHGVEADVMIGTCGKALGAFGAFAATTEAVAALLWNRARSFVFSTALPPMVAAAIEAAIAIVRSGEGDARRLRLAAHARRVRSGLGQVGGALDSAIVPVVLGDELIVIEATARILERRVFVQGIRPPTVPEGTSRLRIGLSAAHSEGDVEALILAVDDAVRQ
jgi:8-amino-7-oxononanoate synthase